MALKLSIMHSAAPYSMEQSNSYKQPVTLNLALESTQRTAQPRALSSLALGKAATTTKIEEARAPGPVEMGEKGEAMGRAPLSEHNSGAGFSGPPSAANQNILAARVLGSREFCGVGAEEYQKGSLPSQRPQQECVSQKEGNDGAPSLGQQHAVALFREGWAAGSDVPPGSGVSEEEYRNAKKGQDGGDLRIARGENRHFIPESPIKGASTRTAADDSNDATKQQAPWNEASYGVTESCRSAVELQVAQGVTDTVVGGTGNGEGQDVDDDLARVLEESRLEAKWQASLKAAEEKKEEDMLARVMEESRREQERRDSEHLELQKVRGSVVLCDTEHLYLMCFWLWSVCVRIVSLIFYMCLWARMRAGFVFIFCFVWGRKVLAIGSTASDPAIIYFQYSLLS